MVSRQGERIAAPRQPVLLGYVALLALGLFIVAISLVAMFFGWRVEGGERSGPSSRPIEVSGMS